MSYQRIEYKEYSENTETQAIKGRHVAIKLGELLLRHDCATAEMLSELSDELDALIPQA